jgi:hypothetical protein
LQPTALVHEAWMRLGGDSQRWENRAHFFGAVAEDRRLVREEEPARGCKIHPAK